MSESDGGFEAGVSESEGDPRVLIGMNAVLSVGFAGTIVWGLDLLGAVDLTLVNVATGAILLFALTYLITAQ